MSVVDEVKQKIDIVDFIGAYVQLRKAGRNFKGLCPFHNEKTPSFMVFPEQGTWHCFGACGTGGDMFTFLMKKENVDFAEALKQLAQRAGVELHHDKPGEDAERKRLREILAAAAAQYHYQLKNSPAAQFARDYLARRFVSADAINSFELGFALDDWGAMQAFLVGKNFAPKEIEAAGLAKLRDSGGYYDAFRGRLMFPIRNRSSEVIGFGARALGDEEPKYLNSPQTALFDKSATLYGLDQAKDAIRAQNLAVIVEGYMDVIGAHQAGFKNVVASLGTALTEKQLGLLKRTTNRYALALDPDAAGEEATKRGLEVARGALDRKSVPVPMGAGMIGFENRLEAELLVIPMPEGRDPDEIIHADPEEWTRLVERAEPLVDFYFHALTKDLDLEKAHDKSTAVQRLTPIIREIGDAVQRSHYTQELSRLVHVPEQTISQELGKAASRAPRREPTREAQPTQEPTRTESRLERYMLTLALRAPEQLTRATFLEGEDFTDTEYRALFVTLKDFVRDSTQIDLGAFRSLLDESLGVALDALAVETSRLSELSEMELTREIETTAYRLRQTRDKNELTQVEVLLRDQDIATDADDAERQMLHARAEFLRRRVAENQRALSARTMFKTRPPTFSRSI